MGEKSKIEKGLGSKENYGKIQELGVQREIETGWPEPPYIDLWVKLEIMKQNFIYKTWSGETIFFKTCSLEGYKSRQRSVKNGFHFAHQCNEKIFCFVSVLQNKRCYRPSAFGFH